MILFQFDNLVTTNDSLVDKTTHKRYIRNTNKLIKIELNGKTYTKTVQYIWLFIKMRFPKTITIENVKFISIRHFKKNVPFKAVFKRPILIDDKYRLVPSFPKYAISDTGECINYSTKTTIKQRTNNFGYKVVTVYDPLVNEYRDVGVHLLVANAWISDNQNVLNTLVNHKDSNKQNNHISNLEWVNHKVNIRHAVGAGIEGTIVSCIVTDKRNDEDHYFETMTDAANFLNVDVSLLKGYNFGVRHGLINKRYAVRFIKRSYSKNSGYRLLPIQIRAPNGEISEVRSLRQASAFTRICRSTLSKLLYSNGQYSVHGFALRQKSDTIWETPQEISQSKYLTVYDRFTNKVTEVSSINECASYLECSVGFIKRLLKRPNETDRYVIKLSSPYK